MKKSLSLLLVLVLVFSFTLGTAAATKEKIPKLPSARGSGTSFIRITGIAPTCVWFDVGWVKTVAVKPIPVAASVGTYDITAGQYVNEGNVPEILAWPLYDNTGNLYEFFEVTTQDPLVPGHKCRIDLSIEDAAGNVIKLLSLYFTAPQEPPV